MGGGGGGGGHPLVVRIGTSYTRGENEFTPHPQNEILILSRGSFKNFLRSPPSLSFGSPLSRGGGTHTVEPRFLELSRETKNSSTVND